MYNAETYFVFVYCDFLTDGVAVLVEIGWLFNQVDSLPPKELEERDAHLKYFPSSGWGPILRARAGICGDETLPDLRSNCEEVMRNSLLEALHREGLAGAGLSVGEDAPNTALYDQREELVAIFFSNPMDKM
jgi:hypothetical protein